MNKLDEARGVAKLVFSIVVLEGLAPYHQDSEQFPHLLLVLLHFICSAQLELSLGWFAERRWLEFTCISAILLVVVGWELEFTDILIDLPE